MERSMNIMRKLWVSGAGGGGGGGGGGGPSSSSLGLMHLRKLFGEYSQAPSDDKIYNMLPLFCKVFGSSAAAEMVERFPEISSFCSSVSKLLVAEVRKRAANESTEAAAIAIAQFLEASTAQHEEDSRGWALLSTLNLLSSGEQNLVELMTSASLPSTLVKCLYLFFDLPEVMVPESKGPSSDFSPMERRLLLQKIFVQLLIRLCSHAPPAEELAKKDDLVLLFLAVTSSCPPQNASWRKSAAEVLMTISTHGLSPPVLSYIHNKGCIAQCIDNLRRGTGFTPLELTEMVLTVFCFLKDSADTSPVLLDDFKSCQGYQFLTEVLLRLESDVSSESQEAIRNLVLVVASLTMCGSTQLKPNTANFNSPFSLPTFQLPPLGSKGSTVRNLPAFQVLQSVFSRATTPFLSSVTIESISTVFKADNCNYFIVDSALPQMAEKLIGKSSDVQTKYLELVEFVVFQLQFTPCKELISISRILKNEGGSGEAEGAAGVGVENETRLKLYCVKMLINLAKHNVLFKDVFREVGILEVLITCLHRFGAELEPPDHRKDPTFHSKQELGLNVIELLTLVLAGNNANVGIFRENNGSKVAVQLVNLSTSIRPHTLGLIQQLLMSQGGEEDMSALLVLLHSCSVRTELPLKGEILGCLLSCFRESHRARTNFRKAGGFLYLMSVLVSLEGQLLAQNLNSSGLRERMQLIQMIFTSFALAMRFEPANAKLFHQEICLPSLADTLRLLGCFSRESVLSSAESSATTATITVPEEHMLLYHTIFTSFPNSIDPFTFQDKLPLSLALTIFIYRLLYDLATDNYERSPAPGAAAAVALGFRSPRKQLSGDDMNSAENSSPSSPAPSSGGGVGPATSAKNKSIGALNFIPPTPEPVVIHSSVVIVMTKLIPSIWTEGEERSRRSCQYFASELVKSLVRNEKNQQLMSQSGLTEEILENCSAALEEEAHFLHQPIHYVFERVSSHSLSPKDLRQFLRLGNPLNCNRSFPPSSGTGGVGHYISNNNPVGLSRVKSLVSMTTPKSSNSSSGGSSQQSASFYNNASTPFPAFIEFDMSAEGFGCLFLPSVAPNGAGAAPDFSSATLLASGMGMGERVFPGTTGMGYSTWFSVDKFSDPRADPHPIRILTVIKEINGNQRLSLCVVVSARDKALLVSTRETALPPQGIGEWEPDISAPHAVRVWCPEMLHEGQWAHLFLGFSPSSNHPFSIYINGRLAHSCKLEYPHRSKGASYSAFIGTPPAWRKLSRLTWRQGVCHFFEDWVPNTQSVSTVWRLGPEYPGSYQNVKNSHSELSLPLIPEDKIMFGLNAQAVSQLTLAKIRKLYSKSDAKAIAKQLGLSSHENVTPISILHNSSVHLIGAGRCLGGVVIGYLGVRIFHPHPVSKAVLSVGGIPVLIGLVAMSTTSESLYASLKSLVCVVKSNSVGGASSATLLDRGASQMLGYLLKRKKHLLSMRVLHLVFGLVSTESVKEQLQNGGGGGGFNDLLCDLDIWCGPINPHGKQQLTDSGASTPSDFLGVRELPRKVDSQIFDFSHADLEKALYEHLLQLLNEDHKNTLELLREASIVPKLLRRLSQSSPNQPSILLLLGHLLAQHKSHPFSQDLVTFGHFIVGCLPPPSASSSTARETTSPDIIQLRNKSLQLLHSLMYTGKVLNVGFCEELSSRLGFDFFLLFATPNLHPSTVLWVLRILLLLLTASPNLKNKFRDGSPSVYSFGRTISHHSVTGPKGSILPLKKQDSKLGLSDEDGSPGSGSSPVSAGVSVASIASGFAGAGKSSISGGGGSGGGGGGERGGIGAGGWGRLSWLLGQRAQAVDAKVEGVVEQALPSEIWLILCAMCLSQPCRNVSVKVGESGSSGSDGGMNLDAIWHYVFALPSSKMASSLYGKVSLCPDAIITLLSLVRCYVSAESWNYAANTAPAATSPYSPTPVMGTGGFNYQSDVGSCIIQFLCYLYSHTPEFQPIFTSPEILSALAATIMPIDVRGVAAVDGGASEAAGGAMAGDAEEQPTFADIGEKIERLNSAIELDQDDVDANVAGATKGTKEAVVDSGVDESQQQQQLLPQLKLGEVVHSFPHPGECNVMAHPAKKIILDVLRMIIIDWMSCSGGGTGQGKSGMNMNLLIDTVLDVGADGELGLGNGTVTSSSDAAAASITAFHTNLLGTLLDHLIAFDLDRMSNYLQSLALFLSRLVDKLWLETFSRDPQVVLDYLLVLINHCRSKRTPPATTDLIYNSFNRVVLFILSRRGNQWDKVETLKKLRTIRTTIFGAGNHQQEFFGCLTHVLSQLVEGLPIALDSGVKTQWHVRVLPRPGQEIGEDGDPKEAREAAKLDAEISSTAEKVWEDLYISKKPMVEETFKISFPSPKPPPLSSLREQIGDCSNKLWLAYVASETNPGSKKHANSSTVSQSWEIHQQLQSKLQKVTGGLTRLAGRSGIRKDSEKEKAIRELVAQWPDARRAQNIGIRQTALVKEILEEQEKFYADNSRHLNRFVRDTLLPDLEAELTRERGIWGPFYPSVLDKWMMDTTEGPCRMRKKLIHNEMFYIHYPFTGELSTTASPKTKRITLPISRDSREFYKKFRTQTSFVTEALSGAAYASSYSVDEGEDAPGVYASNTTTTTNTVSTDSNFSPKSQSQSTSGEDPFSELCVESSDSDNQFMLSRLIGSTNEKISQIFRVAQISGLDTAEGLLLFGKDHFYLVSGFTIISNSYTKSREIKDMYYLPPNAYEPILPPQCYGSGPTPTKPRTKTHICLKFGYEDIREVHKRRYLLQPIALEIFLSDGRNHLLAYPRKVRNVVFSKFTSVSKNLSDSGTDVKQSVAGQRRTASVEQSAGLLSSLIGDTSVTQRWVRGEISNFQYLMHLNTLAGRSYNDLMQYPVFPWILADYDSDFVDLNDPSSFRDLSKPMGAQHPGRLHQFVKRYKEWDDPHGDTPPYHYGTHYSSAMIVCSYLVRMEPFAQHFLRLQGGHFDLADRMFHSIKEAWTSASKHNMADVKELIPEFFYLPDFLMNHNNFDLGLKQNGVALSDVLLPPWAKGDAREFIRVNRMAIESDHVSQHLNEWIDLIFGYRQQGQPAVDAINVFHHLFYEGNVDIYKIDDPLEKNATIGFINNFGQIPKQLFKKPHPTKRVQPCGGSGGAMSNIIKPYNFGSVLDANNPISALAATAGALAGHAPSGEKVFFHHIDNLRPTLTPVKELKGPVGQILPMDKANIVIAVEQNKVLLSPLRYVSWGFADCSVRLCHAETDRPLLVWEQQQQHLALGSTGEIVCCAAVSEKVVVTGSTNTVVSVWEVGDRELRLKSHLFGHSEPISCLAVSPSYNIIVSGSKDTTCIVWDFARLSFVRQLVPHSAPIDAVAVNELTGDIASCDSSWLRWWSVNGELIGVLDTTGVGGGGWPSHGILTAAFSNLNEWDSDNVLMTGSMDGIVRMWSIRYVQVPEGEGVLQQNLNKSISLDSSIPTDSESPSVSQSPDDPDEQEKDQLCVVPDPDKDRDSLEDVHKAATTATADNKLQPVAAAEPKPFPASPSPVVVRRTKFSQNIESQHDARAKRRSDIPSSTSTAAVEGEGQETGNGRPKTSIRIRSSKSETSLSFDGDEGFEVVSDAEIVKMRREERKLSHGAALVEAHKLRDKHEWQRRIIFRGKLTMHTAFDRKDNTEPASITAINVSKDHKHIYVGDARGRIFAWSVSDVASGGRADHWVRDEVTDFCAGCRSRFSITERKHHCRNCGQLFCSKCSRFESEIFRMKILKPVRVCEPCFVQLKGRLTSGPSFES